MKLEQVQLSLAKSALQFIQNNSTEIIISDIAKLYLENIWLLSTVESED